MDPNLFEAHTGLIAFLCARGVVLEYIYTLHGPFCHVYTVFIYVFPYRSSVSRDTL